MQKLEDLYKIFKRGDFQTSLSGVQDTLTHSPNNADALHLGAMILNAMGEPHRAHKFITRALQIAPQNHEMFNTLGNIFFATRDIKRARLSYQTSIDLNATYEAALKNLASLEMDDSNPLIAMEILKRLKTMSSKETVYDFMIVNCLRQSEQIEAALSYLEKSQIEQTTEAYLFQKSQILYELGKFDDAIETNLKLIASPDYAPKAITALAQIYHMTGQWQVCLTLFNKLSEQYSDNIEIITAIAEAYIKSDDLEQAKKKLKNSHLETSEEADVFSLKGQTLLKENKFEEAYQTHFKALQKRPGDLRLMSHLALAAIATERFEDALTLAANALKKNPYEQFWIAIKATGGRLKGQDYKYYYNYSKFVKVYDLKPPSGFSSIEHFNAALKAALNELHGFTDAPLDQTLRRGTQTSPNLIHLKTPILKSFFKMIDDPIKNYLESIGHDDHHPLLKRNLGGYKLHSAWSVKLRKSGHHVNHVHPEGWVSSSYYVETPGISENDPEKSGWIEFGAPPVKIDNLPPELKVAPKAGRLVLFPSYMWHGTIPTRSNETRMTLPFDLIPA